MTEKIEDCIVFYIDVCLYLKNVKTNPTVERT